MRKLFLASLPLLVVACGTDPATSSAGSETEASTGSTGTGEPGPTTGDDTGVPKCVPGSSQACTCPSGQDGAQECNQSGTYDPCVCTGTSDSNSNSDATLTTNEPTTVTPETTEVDPTNADTTAGDTSTGDTSTGDTTTGNVCEDPGPEPNEEEPDAADLPDQDCDADPSTLSGVLDGAADVDWHHYLGIFGFMCGDQDPEPEFQVTASDNVRVCAYFDCLMGQAMTDCGNGSMPEMSPEGRPGCCNDGDLTVALNCSMSPDESADVYVRVDQAPEGACVEYSVDYNYAAP
jgi:hypothetical protein